MAAKTAGQKRARDVSEEPTKRHQPTSAQLAARTRLARKDGVNFRPAIVSKLFLEQLLMAYCKQQSLGYESLVATRKELNVSITKEAKQELCAYLARRALQLVHISVAVLNHGGKKTLHANDLCLALYCARQLGCKVDFSKLLQTELKPELLVSVPALKGLIDASASGLLASSDFKPQLAGHLAEELTSIAQQSALLLITQKHKRVTPELLSVAVRTAVGIELTGEVRTKRRHTKIQTEDGKPGEQLEDASSSEEEADEDIEGGDDDAEVAAAEEEDASEEEETTEEAAADDDDDDEEEEDDEEDDDEEEASEEAAE